LKIKRKILVIGGAGFIGSNLCKELAKDKESEIFSLDNYSTGLKDNHAANVKYIYGNSWDISKHFNFKFDLIFHLGEYSRVEQSFKDVELVLESNVKGTFAVVEFWRKYGGKLIYAGSSTKFGDGGLARDMTPYNWTKAINTELVNNYGEWFQLSYAITYFYNVYGDGEIRTGEYATLIGIYAEKSSKGEPLPVVAPGVQLRNFTHVLDIIQGLIMVAEKGNGDDYGIGSDMQFSVLDVAKLFGGEIKMIPPRKGNRMYGELHTTKIKEIGWEAKYNLYDYISFLRDNNWENK